MTSTTEHPNPDIAAIIADTEEIISRREQIQQARFELIKALLLNSRTEASESPPEA